MLYIFVMSVILDWLPYLLGAILNVGHFDSWFQSYMEFTVYFVCEITKLVSVFNSDYRITLCDWR